MPTGDIKSVIRTEFVGLTPRELLQQSPRALLGVSSGAEAALRSLEIRTVFDPVLPETKVTLHIPET